MLVIRDKVKTKDSSHPVVYNIHIADSLQDIERAEVPEINAQKWEGVCIEHDWESLTWYGLSGGCKAFQATMGKGHPEGVEAIRKLSRQMAGKIIRPKVMRRKRSRGREGDEIDIHSVYSGNLDRAWSQMKRAPRVGKKKVTLLVQVGANSGTNASDMFWGPAAALALSEELTKARYAVEIIAVQPADGVFPNLGGRGYVGLIRIKNFNEPININSLSIMTLGGFHRYFGFKLRLLSTSKVKDTLGSTRSITDRYTQQMVMDNMPAGTTPVFIDRMRRESEAIAEINRVLGTLEEESRKVA